MVASGPSGHNIFRRPILPENHGWSARRRMKSTSAGAPPTARRDSSRASAGREDHRVHGRRCSSKAGPASGWNSWSRSRADEGICRSSRCAAWPDRLQVGKSSMPQPQPGHRSLGEGGCVLISKSQCQRAALRHAGTLTLPRASPSRVEKHHPNHDNQPNVPPNSISLVHNTKARNVHPQAGALSAYLGNPGLLPDPPVVVVPETTAVKLVVDGVDGPAALFLDSAGALVVHSVRRVEVMR